jgi:hypothetical protein
MIKKIEETEEDRYSKFRKQSLKSRQVYRPQPWYASVEEAKEILRGIYKKLGYEITRITRFDNHFIISFAEDSKGKSTGPNGLLYTMSNWPYIYNCKTMDEAQERLIKEGILEKKKEPVIKSVKKRRRKRRKQL